MQNQDQTDAIQQRIATAITNKQPLNIIGGNSKSFLGNPTNADELDVSGHCGIVTYEPTELVITARAGTPISDINNALAEHGQMLAFEPPHFNHKATIGGTVAAALSGPGRIYLGGVRDHVLGCRIINGKGESLRFGGEVMKNVAGYDVTRLMTGAMGTLGVLMDISLKVIPIAETTQTISMAIDLHEGLQRLQQLASDSPLVTASGWYNGTVSIRLAGVTPAVDAAIKQFGGNVTDSHWDALREHTHDFFNKSPPLWRLSVPPLTPELDLNGDCLYDWAGTQRWLYSDDDAQKIRAAATQYHGHATLYQGDDNLRQQAGTFQPPDTAIMKLHHNLKREFDPHGIFNPSRLYPDL
ncbi:MAG: glycolate oxidase subunit GlcE [Pseudomonadota bacterium]